MKTKNVGYAYPTSDIAKHMDCIKTGCYFLAVYDDSKPMDVDDIIIACNDKMVLKGIADDYEMPYGTYSMELTLP